MSQLLPAQSAKTVLAAALLCSAFLAAPAHALEAQDNEKAMLSACEEKLCRQILDKAPKKGPLSCNLGKTWGMKDLSKGAKSKSISWGFGDARCSVKLKISRRHIISALTAPKYEFSVPRHNVNCTVETSDGTKPLKASLAPKLKFKGGKAKKVWIRLKDIDGPEPLSSFVWTTAKLEDSLGIFHSEMIKQINKFVHQKCERHYGAKAIAKKRRKENLKRRLAIVAKRKKARAAKFARIKALRAKRLKARQEANRKRRKNKVGVNNGKVAPATGKTPETASQ